MNVKARFLCIGKSNNNGSLEVGFEPVMDEPCGFSEATPYGGLSLGGVNQEVFDQFEVHQKYDVLISLVEEESKSDE